MIINLANGMPRWQQTREQRVFVVHTEQHGCNMIRCLHLQSHHSRSRRHIWL